MSNNCSVSNGVRKGGILSPLSCFVDLMDDLSKQLNNSNGECIIGSSLINHWMYADDFSAHGSFIYGFISVIICVFSIWRRT